MHKSMQIKSGIMKVKHFLIIFLAIAIIAISPLYAADDDDVSMLRHWALPHLVKIQM